MSKRKVDPLNATHKYPYWESINSNDEIDAAMRLIGDDTRILELLGLA